MFKRTKRLQKRPNPRDKGKLQQFLQQKINSDQFQMVLVEQLERPTTEKKAKTDDQTNSLPTGFKPMFTSTPKRNNILLAEATDKPHAIKTEPRLTMSQFIGELPASSPSIKQQVTVKLNNFVSEAQRSFETIVIDDFTDNDDGQLVAPLTAQLTENNQNQSNQRLENPTSNFDFSSTLTQTAVNSNEPRDTTNFLQDTFENFEDLVRNYLKSQENNCIAINESMQLVFKDLFGHNFDGDQTLSLFSAERKVPTLPISVPEKQQRQQQTKSIRNPILRSAEFAKELEKLLRIDQERRKGNNTSNGSLKINKRLNNRNVEFWKEEEHQSFLEDFLERM